MSNVKKTLIFTVLYSYLLNVQLLKIYMKKLPKKLLHESGCVSSCQIWETVIQKHTVSERPSAFSFWSFKACCSTRISALCSFTASSTAWRDSELRWSARNLKRQSKRVRTLHWNICKCVFVHCNLFCFSLSSCLCISRALRSAWFFSSSSAVLQLSHCLSFSNSSSFKVSSSSTCSSSMVHVVFRVSIFCTNTHTHTKYTHSQIIHSFCHWLFIN